MKLFQFKCRMALTFLLCLFSGIGVSAQPPKDDQPEPPLFGSEHDEELSVLGVVGAGLTGSPGLEKTIVLSQSALRFHWVKPEAPVLPAQERTAAGVAALLGNGSQGSPLLQQLTIARGGEYVESWWLTFEDYVPPLDSALLRRVRDRQPLPDNPLNNNNAALETMAYVEAVRNAHRTSTKAFAQEAEKVAEQNGGYLTYANLFTESKAHRGKVIRLEGKLQMVQKRLPVEMVKGAGISHTYEAWLFNVEDFGARNPIVLVTPDLPNGIPLGDKFKKTYEVAFVGYFFKMYAYKHRGAENARQGRLAPLLIGRMVYLNSPPPKQPAVTAGTTFSSIAPFLVGFVVVGLGIAAALMWWCRRSDDQVRARVAAARSSAVVETTPEEGLAPSSSRGQYWSDEGPGTKRWENK